MDRLAVYFSAPGKVEVCQEKLPDPGPGQLLVRSRVSAISAGTEMLVYQGQFPQDLPLDESLPALAGSFQYPLKYGYALAGEVVDAAPGADLAWLGRPVFSFHPHESAFWADPAELIPIPAGISLENAIFLANMETAVNLVMDGGPALGEKVVVLGQGTVGLLTVALLARFPIDKLVSLDRYPLRRETSVALGAGSSLDPDRAGSLEAIRADLAVDRDYPDADLIFELSGSPAALNTAIRLAGYTARIVVGSWYGEKSAPLDLGGKFHRNRIQMISSQVSRIAPALSGRWSKGRRFAQAWKAIRQVTPQNLITHQLTISEAAQAYTWVAEEPGSTIQVVLRY